ncbi:gamma-glutamyltransferase family protein [Patulibacter defluvii]|uniref:gamma-glutamyltransferase family protein n=1 Tax=Patulibacter defluvii TaxID=3095358 RepID=UPI002A761EA1|nr:gamma-glutamyltransferase [Patulibacter sp. DM4]
MSSTPITDGPRNTIGGGMRANGPTPEAFAPPESLRPTLVGEHYMVAAGHPLVAQVAAAVFERGGNAVDAGVAAGLASNVVQVDQCNLGGVAPIVLRAAGDETVHSVAGLGWWGSGATPETVAARFGGDMPLGAPVGVVPAALSAWIRALQRFGTWTFADCAAEAIRLAREGFPIDLRLAESLQVMSSGFGRWPSSAAVYLRDGRPLRTGERLVQDALGRLLEQLAAAERGATREAALDAVHDAFYRGEPAAIIARWAADNDGWLTTDDLAGFSAEVEPAVRRQVGEWQLWTPSTWCQGPAMLQALAILDGYDLAALGHNSPEYVHLVAEATKLAFYDRERYYGDPRHVDVPLERLLSDEHAAELRERIAPGTALPGLSAGGSDYGGRFDTTYLCTIDADGNAFSAMPSDTLDGAPIIPELGMFVSPRGVQSRLDPAHPAAIAPGKRPRMTPAPALGVAADPAGGEPRVLAFGCPGGDVILQGMLQAFLNLTVFGMTPQQAVEAPRFAAFAWPDSFFPHGEVPARVSLEGRFDDAIGAALTSWGHDVRHWPDFEFDAGAVSMVLDLQAPVEGRRVLAAGADPRRINYALGR